MRGYCARVRVMRGQARVLWQRGNVRQAAAVRVLVVRVVRREGRDRVHASCGRRGGVEVLLLLVMVVRTRYALVGMLWA